MEQCLKNFTEIRFPSSSNHVSYQAKHLIQSLLQKSISARLTATVALDHPWITRNLQ